jgi:hypothetical protein
MNSTRLTNLLSIAALAILAACSTQAMAVPVFLQDYEAPGNLDEPFHLRASNSGSSHGEVDASSTIVLDVTSGALGTSQSAIQTIVDDPLVPGDVAGSAWSMRIVPNNAANMSAANPAFATDGYVGFFLKVAAGVPGTLQVAPLLEDSGGTLAGSGGVLRTVIADGQWHLYQWNMDDPNDFPNTFESFYGGTPAAETLDPTAFFDSIALIATGVGTTTVLNIDQIGYDNAGPLVPEPASLALTALAALGLLAARRRG